MKKKQCDSCSFQLSDKLMYFLYCNTAILHYYAFAQSFSPVPSDLSLSTKESTSFALLPSFIAFPLPAVLECFTTQH